jgi:hypothetical protein
MPRMAGLLWAEKQQINVMFYAVFAYKSINQTKYDMTTAEKYAKHQF